MGANYTYTLPSSYSATSVLLSLNGSTGALSWVADGAANTVPVTNGSGTITFTDIAASQAELEAGSSTTKYTTPGRQQYHPSAAKFFLRATINGGIDTSYNITSISDTGTGVLGVTIGTDFSSSNYVVNVTAADGNSRCCTLSSLAAGSFSTFCFNTSNSATDPSQWLLSGFGDQ